ncbi:hypothetical protein ABK040_013211 [Willaertia magna]
MLTNDYNINENDSSRIVIDEQDRKTKDHWVKRDSRLIRLTGSFPMNAEPPSTELMKSLITPTPLHYVRNHGAVPKLEWDTHRVIVTTNIIGSTDLLKKSVEFTMDEIANMSSIRIPVTITCDGNRRKELNMIKHSKGFNWGACATSTAYWRGVRVSELLQKCDIDSKKAKYLWFEGADELVKGNYGTSIPYEIACDPTCDIILAYEMNDEKLHPDHGFPIRVIIPGMVGGRMVKWLKKIIISEEESDNYYHWHDNKVFPQSVDFSSVDRFWMKSEYTLYEMNINSVITHPVHGERIRIDYQKQQNLSSHYTIKGFAYSGGGRRINRVEVSLDKGSSWDLCDLKFLHDEESIRHGIKTWVWCHWEINLHMWRLLRAEEIVVRAWDRSCNTQPRDPSWNVLGMMNNCWYNVKIDVEESKEEEIKGNLRDYVEISFKHPVQPDHIGGGWKDIKSSNLLNYVSVDRRKTHYTLEEVKKHSKKDDCWIIMDGDVYDITTYLPEHPGGYDPVLLMTNGVDAGVIFREIHGQDASDIKDRFCIGILVQIPESMQKRENATLNPSEWIEMKLVEKKNESRDTRLFRFEFQNKNCPLVGLPTGQHVLIAAIINEQFISRPYTPIYPVGLDEERYGHLDLLVKIYEKGLMTRYLDQLDIGQSIQVKGPAGHIVYRGEGIITIHSTSLKVTSISMIAGGTGITPIYQLAKAILKDKNDLTRIAIIYSNHTEDDILLRKELDTLQQEHKSRFSIFYTISTPTTGKVV